MAVMAMLTWRGIDGMARAQDSTRRYTDDVLALQAGLSQWRADLDAMMVWPVTEGSTPYPTSATQRSLSWDGRLLLGQLCAENRLVELRLARQLPGVGDSVTDCQQAGRTLQVAQAVRPTPNPNFRRVDVSVLEAGQQVVRVTSIVGRN